MTAFEHIIANKKHIRVLSANLTALHLEAGKDFSLKKGTSFSSFSFNFLFCIAIGIHAATEILLYNTKRKAEGINYFVYLQLSSRSCFYLHGCLNAAIFNYLYRRYPSIIIGHNGTTTNNYLLSFTSSKNSYSRIAFVPYRSFLFFKFLYDLMRRKSAGGRKAQHNTEQKKAAAASLGCCLL